MSAMIKRHRPTSVRTVFLRPLEIEHDRNVVSPAQLLPKPLQKSHPPTGEPPQQKNSLLADRIDDIADFLVMKEQVNELADFDVIDGDVGLIRPGDHQVALFCSLELQVPCRNPINKTAREIRGRQVRTHQASANK
jgi:hypothetical protein